MLNSHTRNYRQPLSTDWKTIEYIFGKSGTLSDNVFKISLPRYDLNVRIGKVFINPELAITSWVAFLKSENQAIAMGDLVMLESETAPVIAYLRQNNIDITAFHNHLISEHPKVMYLHFSGLGELIDLATTMRNALLLTDTPLYPLTPSNIYNSSNWPIIESILGTNGQKRANLLQFTFPRNEEIIENSIVIPPAMGVATSVSFQGINSSVATTGDFVLISSEVNPVITELTSHGIKVTAVHNHMLNESPRLFFLHFWSVGSPQRLAQGIKAALAQTNSK